LDLDLARLFKEQIDLGDTVPPQSERGLVLAAFDTLEFEACALEICCWDWDRIGRDRIGDVPEIIVRDLLSPHGKPEAASVATAGGEADDEQESDSGGGGGGDPVGGGRSNDFSQLQWYKLRKPAKGTSSRASRAKQSEEELLQQQQQGDNGELALSMHIHWQPRSRKEPGRSATVPTGIASDKHVWVCLLGARELPKTVRKASIEVADGLWVKGQSDNEYVNRCRYSAEQAGRSKRMYVVGDETEPRDPSFDPEKSRKNLELLKRNKNKRKLRQRAAIAGVNPAPSRTKGKGESDDLIDLIMKQYSNIEFTGVHTLAVRLWEKPSFRLGALFYPSE
jgi:hypothetical protein